MLHIGFGHYVDESLIDCLIEVNKPISAPIRRFIKESPVIDLTEGRVRKSAILTNSGKIILTAFATETLHSRLEELKNGGGS